MSFQVKFSSHHTRYSHVGFLLAWYGIGKHSKLSHYILLSSYHITKLLRNDKNINTHTLGENFRSFEEVNQKFKRFDFIFFYTALYKKETEQRGKIVCV